MPAIKTKTRGFVAPDGTRFGSKAEWHYWQHLVQRFERGEIRELRRGVRLDLVINGIKVGVYTPDALYEEIQLWDNEQPPMWEWQARIVEVKGYVTREWPFRKRVIEATLGVTITEVPAKDWSDAAVAKRAKAQAQEVMTL